MRTATVKYLTAFICFLLILPVTVFSQVDKKPPAPPKVKKPVSSELILRGRLIGNPHDKDAHRTLCDLLRKQEQYRGLANERLAWLSDNPDDMYEVIYIDTEVSFWLNDVEFAIAATRKYLAALDPNDNMLGWASDFLGKELMRRRRFAEAINHLRKAVERNPEIGDYWESLGNALVGDGQTDAGIRTLRHAIEVQPSSGDIHQSLARVFESKGDFVDAETEYKAASNLDKDNSLRLTSLARLQIKRREFAEARATLDRTLKVQPLELYAYLLQARISDLEGRHDRAAEERDKAEALLSDDLRKHKSKIDDKTVVALAIFAFNDSEEIVRLEKPHEPILTSSDRMMLFAAYLDLGRKDEALAELHKIADSPKTITVRDNFIIGEALREAHLSEQAEVFYRTAYEMDPENVTYRYEFDDIRKMLAGR